MRWNKYAATRGNINDGDIANRMNLFEQIVRSIAFNKDNYCEIKTTSLTTTYS